MFFFLLFCFISEISFIFLNVFIVCSFLCFPQSFPPPFFISCLWLFSSSEIFFGSNCGNLFLLHRITKGNNNKHYKHFVGFLRKFTKRQEKVHTKLPQLCGSFLGGRMRGPLLKLSQPNKNKVYFYSVAYLCHCYHCWPKTLLQLRSMLRITMLMMMTMTL